MPDEFRREHLIPPALFADVVARLDLKSCDSDWSRALRIADHLIAHAQDRGPIQADLEQTYSKIIDGYGYCADFVKVFLGLAHAAGLQCRQWAFAFDDFGGHGHTVVEVFERCSGGWRLLDVYNNIHACEASTLQPLSALAFRNALLNGHPPTVIRPNNSGRLGFPIESKLLDYYRRGLQYWYLYCSNAVFSYEAQPLVRWVTRRSSGMGQMVATLMGKQAPIQLLCTDENTDRVRSMLALGRHFRLALYLLGILCVLLLAQLLVHSNIWRQQGAL